MEQLQATQNIASFSSFGPSADGRVKPELSAQGAGTVIGNTNGAIGTSNGTSFSSPLLAGFAASFWQAFPTSNKYAGARIFDSFGKSIYKPRQ